MNQRFTVPGGAEFGLSVSCTEDDSGSFPPDSDDGTQTSSSYRPVFAKGPVNETYRDAQTLDSIVGSDGLHFRAHCFMEVSYS